MLLAHSATQRAVNTPLEKYNTYCNYSHIHTPYISEKCTCLNVCVSKSNKPANEMYFRALIREKKSMHSFRQQTMPWLDHHESALCLVERQL